MEITILQEDWDNGVPYACSDCMLALAIRRECPGKQVIVRNAATVQVADSFFFTCPTLREAVREFDQRRCVGHRSSFTFPIRGRLEV